MTDYIKIAEDALASLELIDERDWQPQDDWTNRCARALVACDQTYRQALAIALEWIDMRCDVEEFPESYATIRAALAAGDKT